MQQLYLLVPLAPLAGAIVVGPVRAAGSAARRRTGCASSASPIAMVASYVVWRDVLRRAHASTATSTRGCSRADLRLVDRLPDRPADGDDDAGRDVRVADGPRLHDRLHGRRPRLHALLPLHLAVHVLDADAGDEQQLRPALLRLGGGRPGLVPADRLLVHAADGDLREPEGVPRQPRRRLRLRARDRPRPRALRHARLRAGLRAGARRSPGRR